MKKTGIKKITAVITFGLIVVMAALGITQALLVKNTEQRANNFTFGNIKIDMTEPEWEKLTPDKKVVYPDRVVKKDPQVQNTGNTALYAYIEVKTPRALVRTVSEDGMVINDKQWQDLFTYDVKEGWSCIQETISSDNTYTVRTYAYTKGILNPEESTGTLFDEVKYANVLEGELAKGTVLEMPVAAYAVQAEYLDVSAGNVEEVMKEAFGKYKAEMEK